MTEWFEVTVSRQGIEKERQKARELKKSQWWLTKLNQGLCEYCGERFPSETLTMDHIVPLARGGKSTKGNIAISCRKCNENKKLQTPVDVLLKNCSQ